MVQSSIGWTSVSGGGGGGGGVGEGVDIVMGMGTALTTSEQNFRMFFKSDERHKVQNSNEASYTFRKDE